MSKVGPQRMKYVTERSQPIPVGPVSDDTVATLPALEHTAGPWRPPLLTPHRNHHVVNSAPASPPVAQRAAVRGVGLL